MMKPYRRLIQGGFLALTLVGVFVVKGNAEAWCPFGGVEALYTYWNEGNMLCSLGITSFYILAGVLLSVVLLRRAFCGYACPIGTLSEWLARAGKRLRIPQLNVAGVPDRVLSLMKYGLLAIILWITWRSGELLFRGFDPCYALISRHGGDITYWAYVVAGGIVVASLLMMMPFCRWLCPMAAVMSPLSACGVARIHRDTETCNGCKKCTRVCPTAIPVHQLVEVKSARCIACTNCVDVCPTSKKDGSLSWGGPKKLGKQWPRVLIVVGLFLCLGAAVAGALMVPVASFIKEHGVRPGEVASVEMRMSELTCRGRANLLVGFLQRDDLHRIPAAKGTDPYFKLEAWPGPGLAKVRISYDPKLADEKAIITALREPIYDMEEDRWWTSPFVIEGQAPPVKAPESGGVEPL